MQLQDRDQTITTLKTDNGSLQSSLNAAETRLAELYADQGRMEEEMAARIEVAEKLRSQSVNLRRRNATYNAGITSRYVFKILCNVYLLKVI